MRSMMAGVAVLLAGAVALSSAQPPRPAFDVVSIKPRAFTTEADLRGFASGEPPRDEHLQSLAHGLRPHRAPDRRAQVNQGRPFFDIVALGPAGTTPDR